MNNNQFRKQEFEKRRVFKNSTSICNAYSCPIFRNCLLEIKQLQQENARLKDKIEKLNDYVEDRISVLTVSVDNKAKDEYFNNKCIGGIQELKNVKVILKEN